jgi:hypothetical protein
VEPFLIRLHRRATQVQNLTIKEQDDPAARKQAKEISAAMNQIVSDAEIKLQQVYTDQPARGIRLI